MKFFNLLDLPYCERSEKISIEILSKNKINAPEEVMLQVYSEHGRKDEFQKQYGTIKVNDVKWQKIQINGTDLIGCNVYSGFRPYFDRVVESIDDFEKKGWDTIDRRPQVISSWKNNKTWLISPVFINGAFINISDKYHLVEGHTRVGVLHGLIKQGILSEDSTHQIWYGDY